MAPFQSTHKNYSTSSYFKLLKYYLLKIANDIITIMQKKAGDKCEVGGLYLCLYHLKNKLKIKIGNDFPHCDFSGIKCEGCWQLKKEIKEKTKEEKWEEQNRHLRRNINLIGRSSNPY